MVEPTSGTKATEVLHSPTGTTSPAVSVRPFPSGHCKLVPGGRWRGYQIDGLFPGEGNTFEATHIGRMEKVRISATLLNKSTAQRRGIWEQLSTKLASTAKIVACLEAQEEEGWRYEVVGRPLAPTLRQWMAAHPTDASLQLPVLEQLTKTLSALHSLGMVHLNIRPELIYVGGENDRVEIILGGLDQAAFYKQSGRVVGEIDLFYAPPEAVNPNGVQPGIGLCAWDWWTVGRIVQEIILGRHVMSVLFESDVTGTPGAELTERARALLLERQPPGLRAGAVEAMPGLNSSMKVVLGGLLTSARDARWGAEDIRLWLAHEESSNHYDLPREARFFTWNGRGRTLVEAADYFRTEEHWTEGEKNIFESENPETLAHFMATDPVHADDWRRLKELLAQIEALDLGPVAEVRRTITTSLVWVVFGSQPGIFFVKGRRVDRPGLIALLGGGPGSRNGEIVEALLSAACVTMIKSFDGDAAGTLARLGEVGGVALKQADQHNWIDQNNPAVRSAILKLSLENDEVLRKKTEKVHGTYASCGDTVLNGMLQEKNPATWVQVLLVVTAENPRRFGYISRLEQAPQPATGAQAQGEQLQVALFWLHLKQLLLAGRPWSGDWQTFSVFWLLLVVFGVAVARDVTATACLAFALMALRFLLGSRVGKLVQQCDPAATPRWTSRDGPERCLSEAQRVWPEAVSLPALGKRLDEMKSEMIAQQAGGAPVLWPDYASRLRTLLPVYLATILICVVGAVQLLKNLGQNLGYQALSIAQTTPVRENPGASSPQYVADTSGEIAAQLHKLPDLAPEMVEKVKRGEYEIIKESFGYTLNGPIQKWAFSPPAVVPPLPVESKAPATAAQRAFALVSGELLLRPYGRKGVTALFVVPVPTQKGFGLMIYNAKDRKLIDNVALTLHEGLPDNTWYHFERYNVIYLGAPSQMGKGKDGLVSLR